MRASVLRTAVRVLALWYDNWRHSIDRRETSCLCSQQHGTTNSDQQTLTPPHSLTLSSAPFSTSSAPALVIALLLVHSTSTSTILAGDGALVCEVERLMLSWSNCTKS